MAVGWTCKKQEIHIDFWLWRLLQAADRKAKKKDMRWQFRDKIWGWWKSPWTVSVVGISFSCAKFQFCYKGVEVAGAKSIEFTRPHPSIVPPSHPSIKQSIQPIRQIALAPPCIDLMMKPPGWSPSHPTTQQFIDKWNTCSFTYCCWLVPINVC